MANQKTTPEFIKNVHGSLYRGVIESAVSRFNNQMREEGQVSQIVYSETLEDYYDIGKIFSVSVVGFAVIVGQKYIFTHDSLKAIISLGSAGFETRKEEVRKSVLEAVLVHGMMTMSNYVKQSLVNTHQTIS